MVGLVIAVGVQRALASVVYLAPGADPVVFVGAVVAMVGIALVASWVPMRRSLKADPVEALRAE
jgi:ABC-type antimicrobial peptide transport system permease subunit